MRLRKLRVGNRRDRFYTISWEIIRPERLWVRVKASQDHSSMNDVLKKKSLMQYFWTIVDMPSTRSYY